ncbi:MAG: hypothetical protein R3338_03930, partial [Thermoanaerobaculia bacterium]|nr:hypothetical protein [Thermoanaerobaculia bacterium]
RLDALEIGNRKLTVQTEFFHNPHWRTEIKIYFGGELKKVYNDDLSSVPESELQKRVNELHQQYLNDIKEKLTNRSGQ